MKVGIVGGGKVAKGAHIPAWFKVRGVEIAAICDNNELEAKKTAKMFNIDRSYGDLTEMLKKEELDIVDICTPPQTHASLSIQAMEAGCNVLSEKPMASNVDEADRMVMASKKHRVKLCIVHNYLFKPVIMKAKSIIEKGGLGDLLSMNVNFLDRPDVEFMNKSHWCHSLPGGRFGENIIHPLYLIDYFLDITDVIAVQAKKIGHCDWAAIDELRVLLDTKNSIGTISLSTNAPKTENVVDIYGTKGVLRIDFELPSILFHKAKKNTFFYPVNDYINLSFKLLIDAISAPPKWMINKKYVGSDHYHLIQKFIESIRDDKAPPVMGDTAKKMMVLEEKIFSQMMQ